MTLDMAKRAVLVAMVVLAGGCGTIFSGSRQHVSLAGIPQEADVFVDGVNVGPQRQLVLKRNRPHTVTTQRPGCRDGSAVVEQSFNAVSVLNLFCLPCWAIDVVSGGIWDLDDQVVVHQDCRKPAPAAGQAMMTPVAPPPGWSPPVAASPIDSE